MKELFSLNIKIVILAKIFLLVFMSLSVLLVVSCSFCDEACKKNITDSAYLMEREGEYPQPLFQQEDENRAYYQLDNWTEATILNFIYSDYEESALKTAFAQKENGGEYNGKMAETELECLLAAVNSGYKTSGWLRPAYWIGGRIFLIPLLHWFNYYQIRMIFIFTGSLLMIVALTITARQVNERLAIAFGLALLLSNSYVALFNISLGMFCYWIVFIAIIFYLNHENVNIFYFFFVIGMLTSFFEWFALSILTFGLLTIYIVLQKNEQGNIGDWKKAVNIEIKSGVGWLSGFVLMFAGRLGVSYMVAGPEVLDYFVGRAKTNTGGAMAEQYGLRERILFAVEKCARGIFPFSVMNVGKTGIVAFFIMVVSIFIILAIKKKNMSMICGMSLMALVPFSWITVFSSYCMIHFWIIYRVIGILLFSVLGVLICGREDKNSQKKKRNKESA